MKPTDPPEPKPRVTCAECRGTPLRQPDPDGVRRCIGHSRDPVRVAERKAHAEAGRRAGAEQRGVPKAKRAMVMSGAVPVDAVRVEAAVEKERARKHADPIPLDSRENVLKFLARQAGALDTCDASPAMATAAAALARAALAAMGIEGSETDETTKPRTFGYATTQGRALNLAGRDSGAN